MWLASERYGNTELRTAAVKLFYLPRTNQREQAASETDTGADERFRERIIDEARALCQVEHPNVVKFYSLQIDDECGIAGLAMEYVAGESLRNVLSEKGTLSVEQTILLAIALTSALCEIHLAGLLHRDIKPANIVESAGSYKLIDFGIASIDKRDRRRIEFKRQNSGEKSLANASSIEASATRLQTNLDKRDISRSLNHDTDSSAANDSGFAGTIGYVDPICVRTGLPANAASDLYSLGVVLFESLVGAIPAKVKSKNRTALSNLVLDGRAAAPPLEELIPDIRSRLANLVNSLLDPKPDRRPRSATEVAYELEQIRSELTDQPKNLPDETTGPFRGLGRYEASDKDIYFGRNEEVSEAVRLLRASGLITLIGASGSGKSSLARAGIAPAIMSGTLDSWLRTWDLAVAVPSSDPRLSVGLSLARFLPHAHGYPADALVAKLAERVQATKQGLIILIDQAEELVTVSNQRDCEWVFRFLSRLTEPVIPGLRAIVTVRRDLLDPLLSLGANAAILVKNVLLVAPLTYQVWRRVLDQSLSVYGYRFEDNSLRDDVLNEIKGAPAAMPLIEFALSELWEQRDADRKLITRKSFIAIGKIGGALGRYADQTYEQLVAADASTAEMSRGLLLALTTPQGTRVKKRMEQLVDEVPSSRTSAIVEHFLRSRLLVRDDDENQGITFAHESLLTQWDTLRRWIGEAREDRELAEEIERDALRWKRDPSNALYLRRLRLAAVAGLQERNTIKLSDRARAFISASRKQTSKARTLITTVVMLFLSTAAIATLMHIQRITTVKDQALRAKRAAIVARNQAEEAKREALERKRQAERAFGKAKQAARENLRQFARHKRELDDLHRQLAEAKSERELAQIALKSRLREIQIRKAEKAAKAKSKSDMVDVLQPMRDPLEMIEDDLR